MAGRIPKIVVIGPAYVEMPFKCDMFPGPGQTVKGSGFSFVPTGAGVNQAIQIAQCDCQVHLLSRVGQDCFGDMIKKNLEQKNVLTDLLYPTQGMSSGAMVTLVNGNGENGSCISAGANKILSRDEIEFAGAEQVISDADACLINADLPQVAVVSALRSAQLHKARTVLVVTLKGIDREVIQSTHWPMEYYNADVIVLRFENFAGGTELGSGGIGDLKFIGTDLVAKGAKCVVVSMGWRGSLVVDRQQTQHIPGIELEVIDQTGCECAFCGALTASIGSQDTPKMAVKFAVAAEALMRNTFGLQDALPKKEDIIALLQEQPD